MNQSTAPYVQFASAAQVVKLYVGKEDRRDGKVLKGTGGGGQVSKGNLSACPARWAAATNRKQHPNNAKQQATVQNGAKVDHM